MRLRGCFSVDGLFGWDFGRDSWYVLGDGPMMTHGSMCAGIVAGRPLNSKKLITGVAPRARLMVLRGATGALNWKRPDAAAIEKKYLSISRSALHSPERPMAVVGDWSSGTSRPRRCDD